MTKLALVTLITAMVSLAFFPWPLTAVLAVLLAPFIPLGPLALGIAADALYYVPGPGALPLATVIGALVSALALLVHARLSQGIIAS